MNKFFYIRKKIIFVENSNFNFMGKADSNNKSHIGTCPQSAGGR